MHFAANDAQLMKLNCGSPFLIAEYNRNSSSTELVRTHIKCKANLSQGEAVYTYLGDAAVFTQVLRQSRLTKNNHAP